jgi:hypothetical protein
MIDEKATAPEDTSSLILLPHWQFIAYAKLLNKSLVALLKRIGSGAEFFR